MDLLSYIHASNRFESLNCNKKGKIGCFLSLLIKMNRKTFKLAFANWLLKIYASRYLSIFGALSHLWKNIDRRTAPVEKYLIIQRIILEY